MTRINLVDPKLLVRQHLVAEYRELPRIFALVRAAQARGEDPSHHLWPEQYTLGTGHCRFFYTRLEWLRHRYLALVAEMGTRGYAASHPEPPAWTADLQRHWYGWYEPTSAAVATNVERINLRLVGMGLAHRQIVL